MDRIGVLRWIGAEIAVTAIQDQIYVHIVGAEEGGAVDPYRP